MKTEEELLVLLPPFPLSLVSCSLKKVWKIGKLKRKIEELLRMPFEKKGEFGLDKIDHPMEAKEKF